MHKIYVNKPPMKIYLHIMQYANIFVGVYYVNVKNWRYSNKKISRSGYLLYRNRYQNKDSSKPVYILRGLFYRIIVDAFEDDLVKKDSRSTRIN